MLTGTYRINVHAAARPGGLPTGRTSDLTTHDEAMMMQTASCTSASTQSTAAGDICQNEGWRGLSNDRVARRVQFGEPGCAQLIDQ
jgi:hypothetical protein